MRLYPGGRVFVLLLVLWVREANGTVLFDGTLGSMPAGQGWKYVTSPLVGASVIQTITGDATRLDSGSVVTDKAGYFSKFPFLGSHPQMPSLSRSTGFTLRFEIQLIAELHASIDRAGFSVIALADDSLGVELGFWSGDVWAQGSDPLFTRAESASFDTSVPGGQSYDLVVLGDGYTLLADDRLVLTGTLRSYAEFGFPYDLSSFVFLGDDTSSASADVMLRHIEVLPWPAWPPLLGDVNGDRRVDLADFGILKAYFGSGTTRSQGDFDGDHKVDLTDFGLLKSNFGASALVPEPTTWVLLLIGPLCRELLAVASAQSRTRFRVRLLEALRFRRRCLFETAVSANQRT